MAKQFLSGKRGQVLFDALRMDVKEWSFTAECKIEDTTNTGDYVAVKDQVFESHIITTLSAKGTVKMDWDALAMPSQQSPKIQPGTSCAMTLYLDQGNAVTVDKATITIFPLTSEVKGKIQYQVDFVANGEFDFPA